MKMIHAFWGSANHGVVLIESLDSRNLIAQNEKLATSQIREIQTFRNYFLVRNKKFIKIFTRICFQNINIILF